MIRCQLRMRELEHRLGLVTLGGGDVTLEHFGGLGVLPLLKQRIAAEEDRDPQVVRFLRAGIDSERPEDLQRFWKITREILALSLAEDKAIFLLRIRCARGKRCEDALGFRIFGQEEKIFAVEFRSGNCEIRLWKLRQT